MTPIALELVPFRAAVLAAHDCHVDVLVRAIAPQEAPSGRKQRAPVNLSIVLDRSGSMGGRPLEEAKRCVAMIVERLNSDDRASLVVYDNEVDVLVPSQQVRDRSIFHAAAHGIVSGGMTALHAGWAKGAEQAALGLERGRRLSRVLLLSDGQANQGLTDRTLIAAQCAEMAAAGVSTSTYGLAEGFNEELMAAMAGEGRGNAYYGETAEDLIDPFQQEFDLLSALCARKLRLAASPADGVKVEVLNKLPADGAGHTLLPDLAYGGEAWAMLRLTVPKDLKPTSEGLLHLLTVNLDHVDLDGRDGTAGPVHLKLPVLPVGAFEAVATDARVETRLAELRAANLQDQARVAARRGNWDEVDRIVAELRVEAEKSPWLAASLKDLEELAKRRETERFSKETFFKARSMRERLADSNEDAAFALSMEFEKPSYLRRKPSIGKRMFKDDGSNP